MGREKGKIMKEIRGSIDIDAPMGRVWQIVTDLKSYPKWNPWITRADGESSVGSKVAVTIKAPGRKDTNFVSEVLKVQPNQEIHMSGAVIKGMLRSDHLFKFEAMGEGKTRVFQSVEFTGAMSPMIGGLVRDQQKGLELMNEALKIRCEAK
jgi:hypothetical protein